jgi:NADH:ubiquinone oxidoreductase subunit 6 (subunit J)
MFVYLAICLVIIVAALVTIRAPRLMHAAIALVLGNSALALLFFVLRAPFAGSVQLSVGAGVVSVLFILAITLTESIGGGQGER